MFMGSGVSYWVRMMPLESGMPHRVKMSPSPPALEAAQHQVGWGILGTYMQHQWRMPWALPHSPPPALTTPNPTPGTPGDADSWWEGAFSEHGDKFPALGAALQPPQPRRGEQRGMRGTGAPTLPTHGHLLSPAPRHDPQHPVCGNGFVHHPPSGILGCSSCTLGFSPSSSPPCAAQTPSPEPLDPISLIFCSLSA